MSLDKGRPYIPRKHRKILPNKGIKYLRLKTNEHPDDYNHLVLEPINSDNFTENDYPNIIKNDKRFLIPKELREYAGLKNEALFIGRLGEIEIWSPETFKDYLNNSGHTYKSVAGKYLGEQKISFYKKELGISANK